MRSYYVYILTNKSTNAFYCGVTNNIERRIFEHKEKLIEGFTKKYDLTKLVYAEEFSDINDAINAEKIIKGKSRKYKVDLIMSQNPMWEDLSP
ncbi:MAG TPA: GIY-YIG nuclease family protein [Bdellovibrionota bacterium]|nr:GIY-YIG nuclease family protein [Bdellovibrionota bacterium]